MKIVSVAEMRALEAAAFQAGVSEADLQQRAGTAVAEEVFGLVEPGERILVLAGHGNNGRDGMLAAAWLLEHGCEVDVALGPRHAITDAELERLAQLGGRAFAAVEQVGRQAPGAEEQVRRPAPAAEKQVGGGAPGAEHRLGERAPGAEEQVRRPALGAEEQVRRPALGAEEQVGGQAPGAEERSGGRALATEQAPRLQAALGEARVVVDALAGIGTHGALREPLAGLARQLNEAAQRRAELTVVALDVPSGLDADTGETPGEVVWVDMTVTLGAVKQGLLRFPGAERVGRLVCRDIGLSPGVDLPYEVLLEEDVAACVPRRPLDAHKYRFGRVLVVAGSEHFLGAPVLCVGGALRAGAGLVTLAAGSAVRQVVASHVPEATYTQGDARRLEDLRPYLESQAALVVGPGLGRDGQTIGFVHDLLRAVGEKPTVIDADGLYALSELDGWTDLVGPNTVLTPHAGELQRLAEHQKNAQSAGQLQGEAAANAPGAETAWAQAGRLARQWGCCLVAKGPFTCVANPDGRVAVWPRANAALATGGTGDVLAGVIGGLLAQGASAWDAARLGVAVHGLAAATIIEQRAWRTLLASDLLDEIPRALAELATTRV